MAVSSDVIFDEDFDYVRIGDTINLLQNDLIANSSKYKKQLVDLVVVNKASHQMVLMKNGNEVRRFWIALSDRPVGHKQFEGDKKTPEGTYTLDYVKQRSNYYKAIHISYPNSNDIANARKYGRKPGGMIMIHGQPPSRSDYHETVQRTDWTNGCIALLNPDIDIFLSLVDVGTPITINP
ncbi:MAG: L,D-transpeptidase family protein [Aeromonadales bacterium]|nr:L,D-transpeptidase family protein [Aeromonadales bacterium]